MEWTALVIDAAAKLRSVNGILAPVGVKVLRMLIAAFRVSYSIT